MSIKNRSHDVFISYSSKNKNVADAIVADLESHNIKCWYAPRDVQPGKDWAAAITKAIENTVIFVLIYTEDSNRSQQVTKEVTLAVNNGKTIIPFRLSKSDMNDTLVYYLSSVHWLDAVDQPMNRNIETLREKIISLLKIDGCLDLNETENASSAFSSGAGKEDSGKRSNNGLLIGIAVAAIAACIGGVILFSTRSSKPAQGTENVASESVLEETETQKEAAEPSAEETAADKPVAEETAADIPAAEEQEEIAAEEPDGGEEAVGAGEEEPEDPAAHYILPTAVPEEYYFYNGHTYAFYDASRYGFTTYDEVSEFCHDQGGHLAVINDRAENSFLYNLMEENYKITVFFGYTDKDEEGVWVWDGDDSDFTNWTISGDWDLPDNGAGWGGGESYGGGEDYAEFNYDRDTNWGAPNDTTWNDASFMENTTIFFCEWDYDVSEAEEAQS